MKKRKLKYSFILLLVWGLSFSQSFDKGQVIIGANIGSPHTFRNAVRLILKTDAFKNRFSGYIDASVAGTNPITARGEYGITKLFGLGLCFGTWNMQISVTDKYNVIHSGQTFGQDEIDTYKFKISSTSFGVRPNFHFPLKTTSSDLYIGVGLGFTKNSLTIDFSSTDPGKSLPIDHYSFSLPGGFYFAPTFGYRYYFGKVIGLNGELGWDKGAIIQGGIVIRLDFKKE